LAFNLNRSVAVIAPIASLPTLLTRCQALCQQLPGSYRRRAHWLYLILVTSIPGPLLITATHPLRQER
jgi:hypothetical protein